MSEFSWESGIQANPKRGYVPNGYDRLRAIHQSDPDNPEASEEAILNGTASEGSYDEDGLWQPGDLRDGATNPVTESGELPTTGKVDSSKYNPGHEPDGLQDGEGKAWRDSVPPNPVN